MGGAGDSFSGAGGGSSSASAIGNSLNVIVQGDNNTVIVNATQTNTGAVTATTTTSAKISDDSHVDQIGPALAHQDPGHGDGLRDDPVGLRLSGGGSERPLRPPDRRRARYPQPDPLFRGPGSASAVTPARTG